MTRPRGFPAVAALALSGAALALLYSRRTRFDFAGKVVLITGGSRGLGLVLGRDLLSQGSRVALLARDSAELGRARATLSPGAAVQLVSADVTVRSQVDAAVAGVIAEHGRLDVVINNAGQILAAPFDDTTDEDFSAMMDVHLRGMLNVTRAALPHLRRQGGGRVVNICSIGGRVPVPHLSAYCASKFAQAGLSGVLAEELRADGIHVTTVLPGLMRTGSHVQAFFKGHQRAEYDVFSTVGGLPGSSMSAERAARLIVRAVREDRRDAVIPFTVRQIARLAGCWPDLAMTTLGAVNRLLPGPHSKVAIKGHQMTLSPVVRTAAALSEQAADRNNER